MLKSVLAVGAHPDDIEFMMAGTFILLGKAGYDLHYLTLANGSCGSEQLDAETIAGIRRGEAKSAAESVGAVFHPSLVNDIEIFYERRLLGRVAAIIRKVAPDIILTHYPYEYMEDHSNTSRLVVSAAFTRGMPNFPTDPPAAVTDKPVAVYHAMPYGLCDPLGKSVTPDFYVDISGMMAAKRGMLAKHTSQKEWLDVSQGVDSYLDAMEEMSRKAGEMAGNWCQFAEGWTQHLPLGLGSIQSDPLRDVLASYCAPVNESEKKR